MNRIPEHTGIYSEIKYVVFKIELDGDSKIFMRLGKDTDDSHTPITFAAREECELIHAQPHFVESGSLKVIDKRIVVDTWYGKTDEALRILRETGCEKEGYTISLERWVPIDTHTVRRGR